MHDAAGGPPPARPVVLRLRPRFLRLRCTAAPHLVDDKEEAAAEAGDELRVDGAQAPEEALLVGRLELGVVQQVQQRVNTLKKPLNLAGGGAGGGGEERGVWAIGGRMHRVQVSGRGVEREAGEWQTANVREPPLSA